MRDLWGRGRGDQGAIIVETALVMPLLFMMIMAVVDFGSALNNSQSIRQGAMDGARQIAVKQMGTTTSCQLQSLGAGWTSATNAACLVKVRTNLSDRQNIRVRFAFQTSGACNSGGTASASAPCAKKGDPIAVCVQYPVKSISGLFKWLMPWMVSGAQVKTEVVERLESDLASAPTNGAQGENALTGGSWSWCTNPTP